FDCLCLTGLCRYSHWSNADRYLLGRAMPRCFPNLCDQQPVNPGGHLDNPGGIGPPKLLFQLGLSDFFCHPGGVLIVTAGDPGVVTTLLVPQLLFEGA